MKIFGDSKVIIDWVTRKSRLQIASLHSWKAKLQVLLPLFSYLDLYHTHREFNMEADVLFKQALRMMEGRISVLKYQANVFICGSSICHAYVYVKPMLVQSFGIL